MRFSILAAALLISCRGTVPWANEPIGEEINLAFTLENNLVFLTTVSVNGRPGRYFLGSAHATSVIDPKILAEIGTRTRLNLTDKNSRPFSPVALDLNGVGDAIIGAEIWGSEAITIDYRSGLVTFHKTGIEPALMTLFSYEAEPAVMITIDGETRPAIVDTASPDTVVLPARRDARATARVILAGTDFGEIDVRYADVPQARIGNRVLSKFVITIDYGTRQVGLWRDPRTPLQMNSERRTQNEE